MERLISGKDVDVNVQGGEYGNALQAASAGGNEQIAKLLLDKGADLAAADDDGWTPLSSAASRGHLGILEFDLTTGFDINSLKSHYESFLNLLAVKGNTDLLQLAHQKYHADIPLADLQGRTLLQLAARGGCLDIFLSLMSQGLNLITKDEEGDELLCLCFFE